MKRYLFSLKSGAPKLLGSDALELIGTGYLKQDPSLKYLKTIRWILDPDDVMDLMLLELHRYKDPKAALEAQFNSYAAGTAAGIANLFKNPAANVLYVCVETTDDSYELCVHQDLHPVAIAGSKNLQPVVLIKAEAATAFVKNYVAKRVQPLKRKLAEAKEQQALEKGDLSTFMEM